MATRLVNILKATMNKEQENEHKVDFFGYQVEEKVPMLVFALISVTALLTVVAIFAVRTSTPMIETKKRGNNIALSETSAAKAWLSKDPQTIALSKKIKLSPDTFLFRFNFPDKSMKLGLPIGKHVKVFTPVPKPKKAGEWNGKPDNEAGKEEIERKYTPSTLDSNTKGYFEMVIKVYSPNEKFCDGGKASRYFGNLQVGDTISVAGPFGLIEYQGKGVFMKNKKTKSFKHIAMIAGGTGVTPMLQLIQAILGDPEDSEIKLTLLFANQTEEDILCREMLEDLAANHPKQFAIHYTLDRPPKGWKQFSGFVTEDMLQQVLPPASDAVAICLCGPPPMLEFACKPNLKALGFTPDQIYEF